MQDITFLQTYFGTSETFWVKLIQEILEQTEWEMWDLVEEEF